MVWRTVQSEWLVEGGGVLHHLVWDADYCIECNSRVDHGKEQLGQLLRCPECGESWTTNSGRAMRNWDSLIEHLLCKNDVANFKLSRTTVKRKAERRRPLAT